MHEPDFEPFLALLDDVAELLNRGKPLTATQKAMYFRAMAAHPYEVVRKALDAHVRDPERGRFFPMPADLLAQLQGAAQADGRPGADEAWSIAVLGFDERVTIVWTAEIAEAWGIAKPVFDLGDEVGARVAFRDAYNRLVAAARAACRAPAWTAALGFDTAGRAKAIAAAVERGLLPRSELLALPAPANDERSEPPPAVRARLEEVRRCLAEAPEPQGVDAKARERTAELKAETARKVAAYTGGSA